MKDKKCFFCAEEKEFVQPCEKCKQPVPLCLGCCGKPIRSCGTCAQLKCFRCLKALAEDSPGGYVTTAFKGCASKSHSYAECVECIAASARRLLATADERFCFICLQDLKRDGILYHNERLGCAAAHETVFCGPCHAIFKQIDISCPACAPVEPGTPRCVLCLRRSTAGISILPVMCTEPSHKLPVCLDCAPRIGKSTFPCRYCVNKEARHLVIFKCYPTRETAGQHVATALLGCRLISNKLRRDNLAVDPQCCPGCSELSAAPFLLGPTLESDAAEGSAFLAAAAVCGLGSKALVCGGFDAAEARSSANCWLVHFQLDGRFREYSLEFIGQLAKRRHAHCVFFDAAEKRFYALGGVCKDGLDRMEYLDSVESFDFDPLSASEDSFESAKWTRSSVKLTTPRAHFSLHCRNQKLYLFGGVGAGGKLLKSVEVVDFARGASLALVLGNAELLPSLQPALHALDANRLLLFGAGREALPQKAVEFDFERGSLSVRTDRGYSVTGDSRVYLARAFERLVALSGSYFGTPKDKSKLTDQLRFRVLGGSQPEVVVTAPLEAATGAALVHDNQYLFDYACVEFDA